MHLFENFLRKGVDKLNQLVYSEAMLNQLVYNNRIQEVHIMTKLEIIDHLEGMLEYSKAMVAEHDSYMEDIWQKDVDVITEVVQKIRDGIPF